MATPNTLILTGYGINCDEETSYAFEKSGANTKIVHINDLIDNPSVINDYQIFMFPGGFSYGDDTGSGKALANKIKNNLLDELFNFVERDTLMLGICNGFQVMTNIGILPALNGFDGKAQVALLHNENTKYQCRWVDLKIDENSPSVFTKGIKNLHIPVAHGEGNFYAEEKTITILEEQHLVTMKYSKLDETLANGEFPFNPNGSINDIASICDKSGRIMGMMPHPERGMLFTQRDDWTFIKEQYLKNGQLLPEESEGIKIFQNAVEYFS